jgi:hypothetical protein
MLVFVALFCSLFVSRAPVQADYVLGEYTSTYRIRDDGTLVGTYIPPADAVDAAIVETIGEDYAVSPDFKTLYQFTNALGYSDVAFAFDVSSRQYLADMTLQSPPYCCASLFPGSIVNARMPLIRAHDPFDAGDLFVISFNLGYPDDETPKIQRYNRVTDSYVETIDPPTPQMMYDFAFGPDDRLYIAAEEGIFVYEESAVGFDLVSSTPLIGSVTGTITFGPDGQLYVRDVVSGNIDRYTDEGVFADTFIPATSLPEHGGAIDYHLPGRGSIQFGADGNLHLLSKHGGDPGPGPFRYIVGKYDGANGNLLAEIELTDSSTFLLASGRVTYLPIPEPAGLSLAIFAAMCLGVVYRRR